MIKETLKMRASTSHGSMLSMRGLDSLGSQRNNSTSSLNNSMTWSSPSNSPAIKPSEPAMAKSASIGSVAYVPYSARNLTSRQQSKQVKTHLNFVNDHLHYLNLC